MADKSQRKVTTPTGIKVEPRTGMAGFGSGDVLFPSLDFDSLLDCLPQGIRIIGKDQVIQRINTSFSDLTGIRSEDVLGRKCWRVFPSPLCQTEDCRLKRILQGEQVVQSEIMRTKRDGTIVPCVVTAFPLRSKCGDVLGVMESFCDITEQKELQARAEETENRYRALIELGTEAGEAIVMLQDINGVEGVQTFVSDQWLRITGYTRKELLGTCFFDLVDAADRLSSIERHQLKMAGGSIPGLFEMSITRKDGTQVPIELTGACTKYLGQAANLVYIRDITARRKAENDLRLHQETLQKTVNERTSQLTQLVERGQRMEEKLRELLEEEKHLRCQLEEQIQYRIQFTRSVVHELKTPLTPLLGANEFLKDNIKEEPWAKLAKEAYMGALELNRRIDDLFDLTRDELGILKLSYTWAEPMEIVQQLVPMVNLRCQSCGHELVVDVPDTLPVVYCDPQRLKQVVYNLIENACKHTQRGTKIKLRIKPENDKLIFRVEDSGPGIKVDKLKDILSSYSKRDAGGDHHGGLGLGLSICKTFVTLHGGEIFAESCPGTGSCFWFNIPLNTPKGVEA